MDFKERRFRTLVKIKENGCDFVCSTCPLNARLFGNNTPDLMIPCSLQNYLELHDVPASLRTYAYVAKLILDEEIREKLGK